MLSITLNYDISTRLTPHSSTIIYHHMKQFIEKKEKQNINMGRPNQTHVPKRKIQGKLP